MKTNEEQLAMLSLTGRIHHPTHSTSFRTGYDGKGRILPSTGGITYNFKIGDNCMDIVGDHIEPGVSLKNPDGRENEALLLLSCIGNVAKVTSGDAKGKKGVVTGKHGGIDHLFVYFDEATLDELNVNDTILIKGFGQGLELLDYPHIKVMNLDPALLLKLNFVEKDHKLHVGVTHIVPAYLMGSGIGASEMLSGDYDIMTQDKNAVHEFGLESLRFGDIIAIQDHNSHNGAHYEKDSVTIGVIVHSDSYSSGHGPGVTVIMSAYNHEIVPFIDKDANLIHYIDTKS